MPHSPLLVPKEGTLLPTPGGGVGGFDKSELYDDPAFATRQHHAKPGSDDEYNMPFGEKGSEPEGTKHGALLPTCRDHGTVSPARRNRDTVCPECGQGVTFLSDLLHSHGTRVKVMITRADEARLRGMGYGQEQIDRMTPEQAEGILGGGRKHGAIDACPQCQCPKDLHRLGGCIGFDREGKPCKCQERYSVSREVSPEDERQHRIQRAWNGPARRASRKCECHGFTESEGDKSVCTCGHQWHEHWHKGGFGCKFEKASALSKAAFPSEPAFRAAQILAQFGRIAEADVRRVAKEIDDLVTHMPIFPLSRGGQPKKAVSETPVKVMEDLEDTPPLLRSSARAAYTDAQRFREELKEDAPGLDAYLYQSEVYCPACGQDVIDELVDRHLILPPPPGTDSSWTTDSEHVPQPLFFTETDESCARCGEEIGKSSGPAGMFTREDRGLLGEMGISASLIGLTQRVKPNNPLLVPKEPDPETATFLKEGSDIPEDTMEAAIQLSTGGMPAYVFFSPEIARGNPSLPGAGWSVGTSMEAMSPGGSLVTMIRPSHPAMGRAAGGRPRCPHCGSDDYGLMPADFETAKCNGCGKNWNHGIVKGINASTKSYGAGTPLGGTANGVGQPAPGEDPTHPAGFQQPTPTPVTPPPAGQPSGPSAGTPAQPDPGVVTQNMTLQNRMVQGIINQQDQGNRPPPSSSIPQSAVNEVTQQSPQADRKLVEQVAESLQGKAGALIVPDIDPHDSPEFLPPKQRKHLDDALVDDSGNPPIPLHKGAGTAEDEPEEDVTDLGTVYGRPLRRSSPPPPRRPEERTFINQPAVQYPTEYPEGWMEACYECGQFIPDIDSDNQFFDSPDFARSALIDHYAIDHPDSRPPKYLDETDEPPPGAAQEPTANEGQEPSLELTGKDREELKAMGIQARRKTAEDAASWWASTPPDARRSMAGRLGIERYWTHFRWTSLPPGVQDMVRIRIQEPTLELTDEDRKGLGEMGIQAARTGWDPLLANKLYEEGKDAFEHGKPDEAAGLLKKSLDINPYNGPAHFMLGIALAQEGEIGGAVYELERALRIKPQENYAYHSLIKGMEKAGLLENLPKEVQDLLREKMVSKAAGKKATWWRSCETCGKPALELEKGQNVRGPVWCNECRSKGGLPPEDTYFGPKEVRTAPEGERSDIRRMFPDAPAPAQCPNCKGQDTAPVDDPESGGESLLECRGCGAFFPR